MAKPETRGLVAAAAAATLCVVLLVAPGCCGAGARDLAYTVYEETPANLIIGHVVRDASLDEKYNGTALSQLRFTLLKESEFLAIDEESGVLTILRKLDREELCRYDKRNSPCMLTTDIMIKPLMYFKMLKVQITVADVNDNAPTFVKNTSYLLLPEGSPVGSHFPLPVAVDVDTDQHGIGDYRLQADTSARTARLTRQGLVVFQLKFSPGTTEQMELSLVLVRPLDREQRDAYQLVLLAIDKGMPPRTGSTTIEVVVLDDNDNAPAFNQPVYSVAISESAHPGSVIASVRASDPDAGSNGHVRYGLAQGAGVKVRGLFDVVPHTGDVKLKGVLDREDSAWHLVPVVASDGGDISKSSMVYVNVTVLDVNDNAPELKLSTPTDSRLPEVLESAANGTFVALLTVADADASQNGVVTCHVTSPKFALLEYYTNEYQVVVNSALDRETEAQPSFVVRCIDGGSPQLSAQIMLKVNILDVNDNAPVFENRFYYSPPIQENNQVGARVLQVRATDNDAGINSEVRYSLGTERDASSFVIDPFTGVVRSQVVFDRELQQDYAFTVVASDRGAPVATSSAVVLVHVEDANDNAPKFELSHYLMRVTENQAKFTVVGRVKATDVDDARNGEVWYRMENDSFGPFVIAHNTGVLSTRAVLDREQTADYQVAVVATDYGVPPHSSTVRVTIAVKDENDNDPFVLYPAVAGNSTLMVAGDSAVNSTVATIRAVDLDTGDNGRVGYFISAGNKEGLFRLCRDTGELKVVKDVQSAADSRYLLSIGVFDYGLKPNTVFTSLTIILNKTAYLSDSNGAEAAVGVPSFFDRFDVNLVIVVTLSSLSGVLSLVLIVAIVRIKKQTKENHSYNCRAEVQRLFGQKTPPPPDDRISPRSGRSLNSTDYSQHGRGYTLCSPYADPSDSYVDSQSARATLQRRLTTFGPDSADVKQLYSGSGSGASPDLHAVASSGVGEHLPGSCGDLSFAVPPFKKPSGSPASSQRGKANGNTDVVFSDLAVENRSYRTVVIPSQTQHYEVPHNPSALALQAASS